MTLRPFATAWLVAVCLAAPAVVPALPPSSSAPSALAGEHVPGEVLVKFRPGASTQSRRAAIAALGHAYVATLDPAGWTRVRTAPGQTVAEALAAYGEDPDVEWAQPNFVYHATAAPNDPAYPQLWGFRNTGQAVTSTFTEPPGSPAPYAVHNPGTAGADMNLEKAWDHVTDCSSVVVAVIDSGVNYTHQDLAGNMWNGGTKYPNHGWDFVGGTNDPMDLSGHGTHVAGTVGAVGNDGVGTTGVCWKATIMALRVLDASGNGTTADIMQAIDFALAHGAKVINMSLGGSGFDPLFSDRITAAQAADAVVVVAAGNDGTDNDDPLNGKPVYPCNFTQPNLVCVAALDQAYRLASFSNYGATSVDVGAPGTNIVSTWPGPVVGDPLTGAGWTGTSTTAGGGWAAATNGGTPFFIDPSSFPNGTYNNGTDDRVFKPFDLTGARAAFLRFYAAEDLVSGDHFRVAYRSAAADPFVAGTGTVAYDVTGTSTFPNMIPVTVDVSPCLVASCTVGFQLQSDATNSARGVGIAHFTIGKIVANPTSHDVESGTSMATPAVTGLAAMLRAYDPQFTYADVVGAIRGGGRSIPALATNTTTGKAVDAMGSLAFIGPPAGLTATVH